MTSSLGHREPQRNRVTQRNSQQPFPQISQIPADSGELFLPFVEQPEISPIQRRTHHSPLTTHLLTFLTHMTHMTLVTLVTLMTLLTPLFSFGQLTNKEVSGLKSGRIADDTSFVYTLPYKEGTTQLFIQGSNSKFSHKHELAYDFKMKTGTAVCASRGGVVTDVRADSDRGGLKEENLSDGNYIYIQHSDGSIACYWHLQQDGVLVKEGDTVQQGQVIGYSGNTGYSAFPHLHFQVADATGKQILVRFATRRGDIYLRPGKSYRRPR